MKTAPFGSPAALLAHNAQMHTAPTTQDIAVVVCGGGDPMAEFAQIHDAVLRLNLRATTLIGNDQIAHFPYSAEHAGTLHPDKLPDWMGERRSRGFIMPDRWWSHRPFNNVTDWTRDWSGSTGLFLVKVARELGHTHIVLCGVPMTVDANHFLRKEPWNAAHGFRRGWTSRLMELKRYVRSYGGWTHSMFGAPTDEWLVEQIADEHALSVPTRGLKA